MSTSLSVSLIALVISVITLFWNLGLSSDLSCLERVLADRSTSKDIDVRLTKLTCELEAMKQQSEKANTNSVERRMSRLYPEHRVLQEELSKLMLKRLGLKL